MKSNKFVLVVDVFNKEVVPGDKVYVISSSSGIQRYNKGTYLGLSKSGRVQVLVKQKRGGFYHKKTGEGISWRYVEDLPASEKDKYEFRYKNEERITTLELNRIVKR